MSGSLTVLAIDDDPGDAELLRRALAEVPGWEIDFVHAESLAAAQPQLDRPDVGFIFLDYLLGADTSDSILDAIRSTGDLRPIVILTGQGDEAIAARLMRGGADDYLVKGRIDAASLRRAIDNARAQHARRRTESTNRQLLEDLQVAKTSLEIKNRRLAELYDTAHQFVDHVSHEFRTPLTVIKEFASILGDGIAGDLNAEQREYAGIIVNRVDDLSALIDDMLDISKIEAGMLGISRRNCTVESILRRVQTTLERRAAALKVDLRIEIPPGLPTVYCDAENAGRIIINLVINAIKFCAERGHVVLRAQARAAQHEVVISVSDDGPGIAPENLRDIFERFRQVADSARTGIKGFGLGLGIVRELVHLNFGDIFVESEVGKGSTFSFTVPVAERAPLFLRYLERIESFRNRPTDVSLVELALPGAADAALLDGVHRVVQQRLRRIDLIFPIDAQRFVVVAATNHQGCLALMEGVDKAIVDANLNRREQVLPRLEARCLGSWSIQDGHEALVEQFALLEQAQEPVCV